MIGSIGVILFFIAVAACCCLGSDSKSSSSTSQKRTASTTRRNTQSRAVHYSYSECPSCGSPYYDGYCEECGYPDINQGWIGENY